MIIGRWQPESNHGEIDPASCAVRLANQAGEAYSAHWKDRCREVVVRFRGAFAYVDAFPLHQQFMPGTTPEEQAQIEATPTHLCRLGYLGRADICAFAFFKYSDGKYEPSFLPSGASEGWPEGAFDCAAQV